MSRLPLTVQDGIAVALLLLMIGVAAVLIVAAGVEPHSAATGIAHPTYSSMLHGGPGHERALGIYWLGWAFGALQLLFFALCFGLGLCRAGGLGRLRLPLVAGAVLHQLCWLWLLHSYSAYSADPTVQTTVLGFPPPTAIMLYVLWPFPLWFVALYVLNFDRFIFSEIAPETEADRTRFENDPRLAGKVIDDVITYTNGKSAEIYGVEFNLVRQFPELPGAFGGLGVYANATFQKSKADTGLDGVPKGDFFNAPEAIVTGAVTYQKYGIEASLAYSWRDRQTARFSSYNTRIVEEAHGSLDGQFSYQLTPRFKLFVNAVDMLNSGKDPILDERYGEGSRYLEGASYTGRTVTFGINASF